MGRFKIKDFFADFLRDWRSGVFTLILVLALFFNLIISENKHAEAAYTVTPTEDIKTIVPEPQSPAVIRTSRDTELARGSNLMYHLETQGVSRSDSNAVIAVLQDVVNLRSLRAGQTVTLHYENRYFEGITLPMAIDRDIRVGRSGTDGFRVTEHYKDLQSYPVSKETVVESSLYGSALESGIEDNIIMELIQLYSFDVDFQRDIQKGDVLKVCYEKVYDEDGNAVDTGNILYTTLKTGERNLEIFRYVDTDGRTDFYNRDGHTVRKTLLKTPINGAYITSSFGRRTHPITGYNSFHKGVDFGAPRGTAIKTSGDGTVTFAGYNEVYGNYVMVRHVNSYVTLYAHMSAFARGMRRGRIVSQGQTIGYVGTTGMSTGPHLHYEVRYNGRQINPSTVKFPPGRTLENEEARLFQNMLASYDSSLNYSFRNP